MPGSLAEIKEKTSKGVLPVGMEVEDFNQRPYLSGVTAGAIHDVKPAKQIIDEMVSQAVELCVSFTISYVPVLTRSATNRLKQSNGYVSAKL